MSALLSLSEGKRTKRGHAESVDSDPSETFYGSLLDHLVRASEQRRRDGDAERLRGLEVD